MKSRSAQFVHALHQLVGKFPIQLSQLRPDFMVFERCYLVEFLGCNGPTMFVTKPLKPCYALTDVHRDPSVQARPLVPLRLHDIACALQGNRDHNGVWVGCRKSSSTRFAGEQEGGFSAL
jgi:hypothetical protein